MIKLKDVLNESLITENNTETNLSSFQTPYPNITVGININDKDQPFTMQILNGTKTIETRNTNSLKPYINKTVGIIRTGKGQAMLVGYLTIGNPVFYQTKEQFDKDYNKHLVSPSSPLYITNQGKFGYPLSNVTPTKPKPPSYPKGSRQGSCRHIQIIINK
jgi:hypothetical protein